MMAIDPNDLIGIPDKPWTRVHKRVLDHDGAIVDLGCCEWEWSERFFGKKYVVGADPFPSSKPHAVFPGIVSSVRGHVVITCDGQSSSTHATSTRTLPFVAITLQDLLAQCGIRYVSALKLNVEGAEYEILMTLSEELLSRIDQIAVSFHDFKGYASPKATDAVLAFLANWYDIIPTCEQYRWFLCVQR